MRAVVVVEAGLVDLPRYGPITISSQQDAVADMFAAGCLHPEARRMREHHIMRAAENSSIIKSGYGNGSDHTYTRQTGLTHNVDTSQWLLPQVAGETVMGDGPTHAVCQSCPRSALGTGLHYDKAGTHHLFFTMAQALMLKSGHPSGFHCRERDVNCRPAP